MAVFSVKELFICDPLSLFFLAVICIVSSPSAVYSFGYLKGEYSALKIKLAWFLLGVFVLSMAAVVSAGNVLVFLIAWEIMSLASYFLVVFETTQEKSIQAGSIYFIMTHLGTAFLTAAFLVLYRYAGSFDFSALKNACAAMPPGPRNIVFLLFLIGFGTKAGIVPLHIWLPYAHPQAPSHISSIMSGVMINTAVYGIIRFVISILGVDVSWWGMLVMSLAVLSCLVGMIYALMDRDIKRLLAYSSIEHIGIILLGVGLAMFALSKGLEYVAVFALIAGLYHLVNHAIFKGLLFLCAGSVYKATGTRDIEKLGGLIKQMPYTAVYFLLGAMAISALPPLNGFVSEWLTLQALFLGAFKVTGGGKVFLGVCAALLALTGGLAAACFVKAFGITFLAQPRSRYAREAKESSFFMQAGMFFLALLTVVFGLCAAPIVKALAGIAGSAANIDVSRMAFALNNFTLNPQTGKGVYLSLPMMALFLSVIFISGVFIYRFFGAQKKVLYRTWDCGYYKLDSRNEYTATAFSKPFRIAFSFFLLPYRRTQKIRESFYHVKSFSYETHTTPVFRKYIYVPLVGLVIGSAKFMRRMQPGSIHLYLAYIFSAVLLLILFMRKF